MNPWDLLFDYTFQVVAAGSAILGLVCGSLGAFAVLRRQSLLGDAMAHAALPGLALAFLLFRSRAPLVLAAGALASGWLGALFLTGITRTTRVRADTAMGLVLAVFFGIGLALLTVIQRLPDANQAGLDRYLFGQAAALLAEDVRVMALLGAAALLLVGLLWKEFKLLAFDPGYAATLGLPVRALDILLTALLVLAIGVGLQAVGVVLMSAMLVAPAAAARQWTDRLDHMVLLAGLFGAASGLVGTWVSSTAHGLSTGPTIVLSASLLALLSLLFAPHRGLVWSWLQRRSRRQALRGEVVLHDLLALARQHPGQERGHSLAVLRTMRPGQPGLEATLSDLAARGWVRQTAARHYALTASGQSEAERLDSASGNGGSA